MARLSKRDKDPLDIPAFLLRKGCATIDPAAETRPDFMDKPDHPVTGLDAEGVSWREVFWVVGRYDAAFKNPPHVNEVEDPPHNGLSSALVIEPRGKGSLVTIFCPFSMRGFQVSRESLEYATSTDRSDRFRRGYVVDLITRRWDQWPAIGISIDVDLAAMALSCLGAPVPTHRPVTRGSEPADPAAPPKAQGGKPPAECLLKRVPKDGKRGKFLAWFMEKEGRPVREAMAEFGMTRSNALSYLFALNKDHGIGYALSGDAVILTLPPGCDDPFNGEEPF